MYMEDDTMQAATLPIRPERSVACDRCNGDKILYCDCRGCSTDIYGGEAEPCESGTPSYPCPSCRGTGQSVTVYANVYAVTRHYGGPEEGGWWYDAGEPLHSQRVSGGDHDALEQNLNAMFAEEAWGDIGSVNGGVEIRVCFEASFAEAWPAERPVYS